MFWTKSDSAQDLVLAQWSEILLVGIGECWGSNPSWLIARQKTTQSAKARAPINALRYWISFFCLRILELLSQSLQRIFCVEFFFYQLFLLRQKFDRYTPFFSLKTCFSIVEVFMLKLVLKYINSSYFFLDSTSILHSLITIYSNTKRK